MEIAKGIHPHGYGFMRIGMNTRDRELLRLMGSTLPQEQEREYMTRGIYMFWQNIPMRIVMMGLVANGSPDGTISLLRAIGRIMPIRRFEAHRSAISTLEPRLSRMLFAMNFTNKFPVKEYVIPCLGCIAV